ncbi:class I SAM-dependent methyltransferase [Geotalea uraniireducens]|uniref:Methyltransferase type 11 n=1 Tax=Geotalea uraniireducens (strain Rf4) TaxID=351605 RepID=A5G6P9_GEOUR|nr:class I SAM-dependent methyltransferase [Geotalea uraniireducens]ABQ27467.1 Methyltransferase type 11 [Geotalea uraniireducens Rf4]
MKVRDSGMPEEEMWSDFFDPEKILRTFGLDRGVKDIVEFGCGYGTFTLAAAKLAAGTVHALDIEPEMVETVREKCRQAGVDNVHAVVRDFVAEGTGLQHDSIDAALLFNILHNEEPLALMTKAFHILKPGGRLAVIHWNYDPATPRGPAMEIRPRPEQCIAWGRMAGFTFDERERFDLPPYHYGLLFRKPFS